ncbi:unnamed protein product [Moneuplotes crassus]|uniref:Uncharacterized protein n=1 Tax=Euplotes crassus TaxID=5936 RepID=A0AAD1U2Y5_EUPCR|nr:unnamed protein product [Moneuplotes crassus]
MGEATLRQETCHNHTSQIIIPEGMKSFISDLESKVGHFNTLNRAVNDIMEFAAQKPKSKLEEYEFKAFFSKIQEEIDKNLKKLHGAGAVLENSDKQEIDKSRDKLWEELCENNWYQSFSNNEMYLYYFNNKYQNKDKLQEQLVLLEKQIQNLELENTRLRKRISGLNELNAKVPKFNQKKVFDEEKGKRVRGISKVRENNSNQVSDMSNFGCYSPKFATQSDKHNCIQKLQMPKRERKGAEKHREIIEEDADHEDSRICETVKRNQNHFQSTGITSEMEDLCVPNKNNKRSFIEAPEPKSYEDELNQDIKRIYREEGEEYPINKICNEGKKSLISNSENQSSPAFIYSLSSSKSRTDTFQTSKIVQQNLRNSFSNASMESSSYHNELPISEDEEQQMHSPRSNSIAEDTEGPKEEVIEESKSDMHMKTGSQNSDYEISYPPEGSSVSFNLCSEQDQAFFHDCTSKLQNLQFVEFQVGNEIPEGFFKFINEYFPDKVQNCKWSSIISPEFLSIDSFLDAILEVSANVKEALEISNFSMDQAQFNRLIDQCKAEKELIFTSCLFKIRDMQNLFKNSERTEKIDLSFNDNHYVDESIESAEDPPILPFSNILEAYKDPEDS